MSEKPCYSARGCRGTSCHHSHLQDHALDPIEECKLNARLQGKHEIPGAGCQQHHGSYGWADGWQMAMNHWKAKCAHPHGREIS